MKFLLALLLLLSPGVASAWTHGVYTVAPCPQGSAYADGCAASPGGNVQNATFFTGYAQQSRQSYATRPPWNVPGVDYAVGIPAASLAALKDPAVTQPSGCTYQPTGSASGGPRLLGASAANITIDGYDFSLHNCVVLQISASATGTLTVKNSNFKNGSNCSPATNGFLLQLVNGGGANCDFENNVFDGDAINFPNPMAHLVTCNTTGTFTSKYNAYLRSPARPVGYITGASGIFLSQYDYVEGFCYHSADGHAEFVILSPGSSNTMSLMQYSFDTLLTTAAQNAGVGTASIYISTGQSGSTFTTTQVDHNVMVTNYSGGASGGTVTGTISGPSGTLTISALNGAAVAAGQLISGAGLSSSLQCHIVSGSGLSWTVDANCLAVGPESLALSGVILDTAGAQTAYNTFTNLTYSTNYIDATGANRKFSVGTSAAAPTCTNGTVFTGNVNLLTGGAISGYDTGSC